MNRREWFVAIALAALAGCVPQAPADEANSSAAQEAVSQPAPAGPHVMPIRGAQLSPSIRSPQLRSSAPFSDGNGIDYHLGGILAGTPSVYLIFYGDWGTIATNSAWSIFIDWAERIGGSSYWGINTTYYDNSGNHVLNSVRFGGLWYDKGYSQGKSLDESAILRIVQSTLDNNELPRDTNGVYMVLTAADVQEGKFCSSYCGYHGHTGTTVSNGLKYAFIGNATACPGACIAGQNRFTSPNDNPIADGMVSVMTHELEETVTNPAAAGWYALNGEENGDLCAWNFGPTTTLPNGSQYNVALGDRRFLIQQDWLNANGGLCTLSYPHDTLAFDSGDTRRPTGLGDWKPGSYKSECGPNGAVTGLSSSTVLRETHAAFCTDEQPGQYSHQACRTVDFSGGDNRGTTATGDWDPGFPKGECGVNEYVAGVSQRTNGFVDSILCCAGAVSHAACTAHAFHSGDSRENPAVGDWDYGFNKADCGPGRFVAGVSRNTRSLQYSGANSLLCCQ
jgi:hypothetical protein